MEITKLNLLTFHFFQNPKIWWIQQISKMRTKCFPFKFYFQCWQDKGSIHMSLAQALTAKAAASETSSRRGRRIFILNHVLLPSLVSLALQNHGKKLIHTCSVHFSFSSFGQTRVFKIYTLFILSVAWYF